MMGVRTICCINRQTFHAAAFCFHLRMYIEIQGKID